MKQEEINEKLFTSKEMDELIDVGLKAGSDLLQKGQFQEAKELFLGLLKMAPNSAEVHNGVGVAFDLSGENEKAINHFRSAVKLAPNISAYYKNFGSSLLALKRHPRAIRMLEKAIALEPNDHEAMYKLALAKKFSGNIIEYQNLVSLILETNPSHTAANSDLGIRLLMQERINEAITYLERATQGPDATGQNFSDLGGACLLASKNHEALSAYEEAVSFEGENIGWLVGLAIAERNTGALVASQSHAEKATNIDPKNPTARNVLGTIKREKGFFNQALKDFNLALEVEESFSPAKINRGLLHLLQGNWEKGFLDLEARWSDPSQPKLRNDMDYPLWNGSNIKNKTVFIYTEQGFGDTIQFFRFTKSIVNLGGKVILEVPISLKKLLTNTFKNVAVISNPISPPKADFFSPLLRLPHILKVKSKEDLCDKPYLAKSPLPKSKRKNLKNQREFKVGLNWSGATNHKEDYKRSIDPGHFEKFSGIDGVIFTDLNFNLEVPRPSCLMNQTNIKPTLSDFNDTARIMEKLDLVISVDTATLHLAGALGVKCWALIPFSPDWRWGTDANSSPWYNSVELFRQPKLADWSTVIDEVIKRLKNRAI